ncbi:MAG: DUF979 domain-containing protein [Elusimicrobiota bacterium]|jgi:uncharacterized membrane protein|nr:DUF979 domain-containing protein [Elusimicrobiota bacterium]
MKALLSAITLEHLYLSAGIVLRICAIQSVADKKNPHRIGTGLFWLLFGLTFLTGNFIDPKADPAINRPYYIAAGSMVVAMTAIACLKKISVGFYNESTKTQKLEYRARFGNAIFIPLLIIPIVIFSLSIAFKINALIGLGIGAVIGFIIAICMTRPKAVQMSNEGRRVIDAIGWAIILSQFLAALGFLFNKAGVGEVIAVLVSSVIPENSYLMSVVAYALGMMIFTMIMGNAFAAFAVITTGIGIPLVINLFGANPAAVGALAMVAGYCGTLITPMAANFNVVPAALLEMKDKNGVIKAQLPMALIMIIVNIIFMYIFGMIK